MGRGFDETMIRCPFYHRDDRKRNITCEGVTDTSRLILRFRSRQEFLKQLEVFCCGRYSNCEVYRAAAEKYE